MGMSMSSPVDVSYPVDNVMLSRYFEAVNNRLNVGGPLSDFHGVLPGVPTYLENVKTLDDASEK